jgi:hypothetical protein
MIDPSGATLLGCTEEKWHVRTKYTNATIWHCRRTAIINLSFFLSEDLSAHYAVSDNRGDSSRVTVRTAMRRSPPASDCISTFM